MTINHAGATTRQDVHELIDSLPELDFEMARLLIEGRHELATEGRGAHGGSAGGRSGETWGLAGKGQARTGIVSWNLVITDAARRELKPVG